MLVASETEWIPVLPVEVAGTIVNFAAGLNVKDDKHLFHPLSSATCYLVAVRNSSNSISD